MKNKVIENPEIIGCLNCSRTPAKLPKDAICAVGLGVVNLTVNDTQLWGGDDENMTVAILEDEFKEQIENGECVKLAFWGPLHSETYERNKEDGEWYLIEQGMGFA